MELGAGATGAGDMNENNKEQGSKGEYDDSSSDYDTDEEFDAEDLKDSRRDKAAHDYIVGEQDYDPDSFFNFKPWIRSVWQGFSRARMINMRIYKVKSAPVLEEASEVLLNLCKYRTLDIFDVIELLELGASVNYCPRPKKNKRPDTVDPTAPPMRSNGATALHWCARRGHTHVLWAMLQPSVNANVNITDNRNSTPLMLACDHKSPEQAKFVRILLKHPKIKVNIRDAGGNTALLNAIYKNNVWVVRELLMYSPQQTVPAISVLERQELEDPNAYEIAQFIFSNGLLMNPIDVDPIVLEPALGSVNSGTLRRRFDALCYYLFSLKGHYKYIPLLYWQTFFHYDAALVLRMIQRKSYEEGRRPEALVRKPLDPDDEYDEDIDEVDTSHEKKIVSDRHKRIIDKYYAPKLIRKKKVSVEETREDVIRKRLERRQKLNIERGADRTAKELEEWNRKRRNNAEKVNEDFDHRFRGKKSTVDYMESQSDDTKRGSVSEERGRRGSYKPPEYFDAEDEKHLRTKEWIRNKMEGSKGDWKIQNKYRKGHYSNVPPVAKGSMPKDIKLEKHNRQKYERTHVGVDLFEEEHDAESDAEVSPSRANEWKAATRSSFHREKLHKEIVDSNPEHFNTKEHVDPNDPTSPIKYTKLNSKPGVSLTKSLQMAREMRQKGTMDGVPVPTVQRSSSAVTVRPATSADYTANSLSAKVPVSSSSTDDSGSVTKTKKPVATTVPVRTYKASPKKLIRTDIGFVDTTSPYGKYKLEKPDQTVTIEELNNRDYDNDDGYDDEEL